MIEVQNLNERYGDTTVGRDVRCGHGVVPIAATALRLRAVDV